MTEQGQVQGRARSNSLQRMLNLEKKLLLERTQGATPNAKSQHPSSSVSSDSLPPTPTSQRRFELSPRKENQKAAPIPTRNYSGVLPPLVIHTAFPQDHQHSPIPPKRSESETNVPGDTLTSETMLDKHSQKTVAFMFPPEVGEQSPVCRSPTWEAYGRRKLEKKEEKRERRVEKKKEKEQSSSESKPRGRRLSKAPPPTSSTAPTLGDRSITDPAVPTQKVKSKQRPSSVLGIPFLTKRDESEKPKDRRSGSLTSAIRNSFEIRRSSFDRDSDFVGGIKLKEKKTEFHQQVLRDQAQGTSTVHPALRKSFVGHGSFTPLKVDKEEMKASKNRAYPPISIQAASARNPALLTPTSPAKPDSTNIYLWSARARGSHSEDDCAVYDSEDQTDTKPFIAELPATPQGKASLARSGGIYVKTSPQESQTAKFASRSQEFREQRSEDKEQSNSTEPLPPAAPENSSATRATKGPAHIAYAQKGASKNKLSGSHTRGGSFSSILSAMSIAPEAPRNSSKRNSLVLLQRFQPSFSKDDVNDAADILGSFKDPYTPPRLELRQPSDTRPGDSKAAEVTYPSRAKSKDKTIPSSPPSIPYERTSAGTRPRVVSSESWAGSSAKWNIKDAAKGVFGRASSTVPSPSSATFPPKAEGRATGQQGNAQAGNLPSPELQFKKGHSISASMPTIPTAPPVLVPRTYSPMADSPSSWRPEISSSEDDSNSDAIQSASPPSTPNTSPPMSDAENQPYGSSTLKKPHLHARQHSDATWSSNGPPQLLSSAQFQPGPARAAEDSDVDPIEEAARKVMEAFPKPQAIRDYSGASDSDSSAAPAVRERPIGQRTTRSRQVSMAPESRSVESLHSANYLEAARRIAPAQPPRGLRSPSNAPLTPSSLHASETVPLRQHKPSGSLDLATEASRCQSTLSLCADHGEPIAKMFVECCACKFYHDMPSKLYQAMANPAAMLNSTETLGSFMGKVSMTVKCPWCKHEMSTKCCAGFAAMVYIKEKLH